MIAIANNSALACCVGHEIVGKAVKVGSNVKHVKVGDRGMTPIEFYRSLTSVLIVSQSVSALNPTAAASARTARTATRAIA